MENLVPIITISKKQKLTVIITYKILGTNDNTITSRKYQNRLVGKAFSKTEKEKIRQPFGC